MASSSISATLFHPLAAANSSTASVKAKPCCVSMPFPSVRALNLKNFNHYRSATRVSAAPEALDSQEVIDGPDIAAVEVGLSVPVRLFVPPYVEVACLSVPPFSLEFPLF